MFAELPGGVATPELRIDMPESRHAEFMQALIASASFPDAEIATVDGLRVDFSRGWGLIRASNTTPVLVLRFEADDEQALAEVQAQFRALIQKRYRSEFLAHGTASHRRNDDCARPQ